MRPALRAALFGGGLRPALDLNFAAMAASQALDPRVTFSRASAATRIGPTGLIELVASGNPRFTYDPVTLTPLGLLIEEQRTNLLLNSTIDGANLATQSVTVAATAYTLSFYGNGTVTLSGVSTAGPLVGSGAYPNRSSLTFTPTAGSLTLTVTGTVQFANLETGVFATSYIPTAGSSVVRLIDVASVSGANLPTIGSNYTAVGEYQTIASASERYILGFSSAGLSQTAPGFGKSFNGSGTITTPGTARSACKIAGTTDGVTRQIAFNGGAVTSGAGSLSGSTPTSIGFGAFNSTVAVLNAPISRVRLFLKTVTNNQLQALTA